MQYGFLILTWVIVFGFVCLLFLQGPKGRFARMRCALRGRHDWQCKPSGEQRETPVVLTVELRCGQCKEYLKTTMEIEPEAPMVGPTIN